jgi:hypothetical protein
MPKFIVPIVRVSYSVVEVEVEADNKDLAFDIGRQQATVAKFPLEYYHEYQVSIDTVRQRL